MVTTAPVTMVLDNGRFFQYGRHTLASIATEDTLTIKAVYDVRDFEKITLRIKNTDGADSLDYYIEASVLEVPDDASPASDWFVVKDIDGVSLTNIALAFGIDANRIIDVSHYSFLRVRTENTSAGNNAEVSIDANSSVKRV